MPRPLRAAPRDPAAGVRVEAGTMRDYHRLAPFHYRAGRPATVVRVLRAVTPRGELAGVLVVSMPTLNGAWRRVSWPGRYSGGDRRADAARLNAEVRTISRVIVDPRWRALGIAGRLARAYLRRPLTRHTEAVAAMGACCPFFAGAGMTEVRPPPAARDRRLRAALRRAGRRPESLLRRAPRSASLRRALRRWANDSGSTRRLLGAPARELAAAAGLALLAARIAYTHTSRTRTNRGGEPWTSTRSTRPRGAERTTRTKPMAGSTPARRPRRPRPSTPG